MKNLFTTLLALTVWSALHAQVIWTDPVFPKADQPVTIYFDAAQGSGGLAGCNCDVYIHTGVITTQSSTPSDWKNVQTTWGVANADWQLEPVPGQPDLYTYTIEPSIQEFYAVLPTDTILELAMVFRNSSGTITGKDVGDADIFYPVYPADLPFSSIILQPNQPQIVATESQVIPFSGAVSETADLFLYLDGNLVAQDNGLTLEYDITASGQGTHVVEFVADNGTNQITESFKFVIPLATSTADLPAGAEPGINLLGDTAMILALYAPDKSNVFVIGAFNDWELDVAYQMNLTPDGNTWWLQIDDLVPGETYLFQYFVDGGIRIGDPYSELVLDPFNDPFIPEITFPDLPAYPIGKTTGYVSVVQPGAVEYDWAIDDFDRPDQTRLVVYELLVRDFIARHDYETLIDTLDYLQNLGVNAIELMPVNEFEGNISWGYNPSYHMALDKYYGTPNEFKRFVDTCHARGIAVIVDVVYNHAFSQSPFFQLYNENGNPTPDNPWLNVAATHPFNVGYDFNHESEATKFFVKKVMRYWLTEYKLDGFRFDLSKGFTQTNNPNNVGAWGAYDASRIAILKDYADEVWDASPGAYAILEHFADNTEEKELANYGMMLWGNMHGAYTQTAKGLADNLTSVSYKARGFTVPHLVHYMESHDEERLMYSALQEGSQANPNHNVRDLEVALRRIELNSAFFYTIPGPKMLWQFGEMGYDISIDFNGRTGPKPIKWEYLDEPERRRLYDVTASLIQLRNQYESFHTDQFLITIGSTPPAHRAKSVQLLHPDMNVNVLGNFHLWEYPIDPKFPSTGVWYEYFSGDSIVVTDVNAEILLTPSEYRLYTDVKLPAPPMGYIMTTGVSDLPRPDFKLGVFPNPASGPVEFAFDLPQSGQVRLEVFHLNGQRAAVAFDGNLPAGANRLSWDAALPSGNYWAVLVVGEQTQVLQISIQ